VARELFRDIELEAIVIGDVVSPRIHILSMSKPDVIYSSDYYLLEKFELDKENPDQMYALSMALTYQSVLYYMGTRIYMSASLWMSEWDLLVEPEYIDIKDKFEYGIQYLIDTDTDVDKYIYVYRIMAYHAGVESSSSYVAGVQYIDFLKSETLIDAPPISASSGRGTLYREDSDGKMIVKGLPGQLMNPRYNGPIEYEKEWARRRSIYNSIVHIGNIHSKVEEFLSGGWNSLEDGSYTIIKDYRGKV
jgi:hypothetical protein